MLAITALSTAAQRAGSPGADRLTRSERMPKASLAPLPPIADGGGTCAPCCAAVPATGAARADRSHLDNPRRPLLRAAHPCDRPHAESGDVAHRRLASRQAPQHSPPRARARHPRRAAAEPESPVICEGERMPRIHPGQCAGCGACQPVCAAGPLHRPERPVLPGSPARPAAPPRPARCPATPAGAPARWPAGSAAMA
jgi:ferredoxin